MVLISLKYSLPLSSSIIKSIRDTPLQPSALKDLTASSRTSSLFSGDSSAGILRDTLAMPLEPLPLALLTSFSSPSTEQLISRRFVMACSTSTLVAYLKASSTEWVSSTRFFATLIPTLEPKLTGFTITG